MGGGGGGVGTVQMGAPSSGGILDSVASAPEMGGGIIQQPGFLDNLISGVGSVAQDPQVQQQAGQLQRQFNGMQGGGGGSPGLIQSAQAGAGQLPQSPTFQPVAAATPQVTPAIQQAMLRLLAQGKF